MLSTLGDVFEEVITWCGSVVTALTGSSGALAPLKELFLVGIAISIVMVGIKIIRKVVWGN